jgi:hypothetical protein
MAENWKEENQSVMSSYIQFITAFLSRFRDRLVSDRPAIELILSKIIEIDHIELFFRFLEAIMQNTTLEEFNNCGYMPIFVQGSQALARSIQGRKAALLFMSKMLVHYGNHLQVLHIVLIPIARSIVFAPTTMINCWMPALTSSRPFLCVVTGNSSSWLFARPLKASIMFLI